MTRYLPSDALEDEYGKPVVTLEFARDRKSMGVMVSDPSGASRYAQNEPCFTHEEPYTTCKKRPTLPAKRDLHHLQNETYITCKKRPTHIFAALQRREEDALEEGSRAYPAGKGGAGGGALAVFAGDARGWECGKDG